MANLSPTDIQALESLFVSGTEVNGFDRDSLKDFILSSTGIDVHKENYGSGNASAAQILRAFLKTESNEAVGQLIQDLVEHDKLLPNTFSMLAAGGSPHAYKQNLFKSVIKIAEQLLTR